MIIQTDAGRRRASLLAALAAVALVAVLAACGGGTATSSVELTCVQADADNVVALSAQNLAFSANCLEVEAGEPAVIEFTNTDSDPHNVAVYQDSSKATEVMRGDIVTGPDVTVTYDVPALEPGDHYFDCTVHTGMKGVLRAVDGPGASPG